MSWMCDGTQALGWVLSVWGGKLEGRRMILNLHDCMLNIAI